MTIDIVIPTKGRHRDLRIALSAVRDLLKAEVRPKLRVGICISDSSETGFSVEEEFPELEIKYLHAPHVSRFVENLWSAISLSDAEYLWLMGDDDIVLPGAFAEIAGALDQAPPMIHVNAILRNSTSGTSDPLVPPLSGNPERGPISQTRSVDALTYLSCLIFRKDVAKDPSVFDEIHRSEVASHLRLIDKAATSGDPACILRPLVLIEKNEQVVSEWNGHWCVLFGYEAPRLRHAFIGLRQPVQAREFRKVIMEVRMHLILSVFRVSYPSLAEQAASFNHEYRVISLFKKLAYILTTPRVVRILAKKAGTLLDPRCSQLQ